MFITKIWLLAFVLSTKTCLLTAQSDDLAEFVSEYVRSIRETAPQSVFSADEIDIEFHDDIDLDFVRGHRIEDINFDGLMDIQIGGFGVSSSDCNNWHLMLNYSRTCSDPVRAFMLMLLEVGKEEVEYIAEDYQAYINNDTDSGSYEDESYEDESYEDASGSGFYYSAAGDVFYVLSQYDRDFPNWANHEGLNLCDDNGGMEAFESCMIEADITSTCTGVSDIIQSYRKQFCRGNNIRGIFNDYDATFTPEKVERIQEQADCIEISDLYGLMDACSIDWYRYEFEGSLVTARSDLRRTYLSMFSCIRTFLRDECTANQMKKLKPFFFEQYVYTYIPGLNVSFNEVMSGLEPTDPRPHEGTRVSAVVFGDPHLLTFASDTARYQTCNAEGRPVYFENPWLYIHGINSPISASSNATVMAEVDITIYDPRGNDENGGRGRHQDYEMAQYVARLGDLPTRLHENITEGDYVSDVELEDLDNGAIHIKSYKAGLSIVIKAFGVSYTMVVRMGKSGADSADGLLASGCPEDQVIYLDRTTFDELDDRRKRQADVGCGTGDFADACRFDYQETGSLDIALGSVEDLFDLIAESESADDELTEIREPEESDAENHTASLATTFVLLFSVILWR